MEKNYKLSVLRKGIISIDYIKVEFEDTFSSIHLRQYYVDKWGLKPPCKIDKVVSPTLHNDLLSLVARVNLFKPREEVPNKTIHSDIPGKSKLIRSADKSTITLTYRDKGNYCQGGTARSNNTCFISETDSFDCYHSFYERPSDYTESGKVYYLTPDHPLFRYWSDYMDAEYCRLAGRKYKKLEHPVKPEKDSELVEQVGWALAETGITPFREIVKELSNNGLCRINDLETSVYNNDGYWLYDFEEYEESDPEANSIFRIIDWLDEGQTKTAIGVIEKFIVYPEDINTSLFD